MKPLRNRRRRFVASICLLLVPVFALNACGQGKSPTPAAQTLASAVSESGDDLFAQANAYSAEGKWAEAEAAYRQAIAIDPNKASYWQNLGVTYYQMQRLPDSEQSLQSGLKLAPGDAQLNYLLGVVYLQQARFDEASTYLLKANQLDPNLPEPYYGLGALYKQQGKRDEAIQAFERFLELGPGQDPNAVPSAKAEIEALQAGQ